MANFALPPHFSLSIRMMFRKSDRHYKKKKRRVFFNNNPYPFQFPARLRSSNSCWSVLVCLSTSHRALLRPHSHRQIDRLCHCGEWIGWFFSHIPKSYRKGFFVESLEECLKRHCGGIFLHAMKDTSTIEWASGLEEWLKRYCGGKIFLIFSEQSVSLTKKPHADVRKMYAVTRENYVMFVVSD